MCRHRNHRSGGGLANGSGRLQHYRDSITSILAAPLTNLPETQGALRLQPVIMSTLFAVTTG